MSLAVLSLSRTSLTVDYGLSIGPGVSHLLHTR